MDSSFELVLVHVQRRAQAPTATGMVCAWWPTALAIVQIRMKVSLAKIAPSVINSLEIF